MYVLLQTFDFTLIPIQFYAITLLKMWCDFIRVFQHFLQAVELPKKRSSKVTRTRDLIHGRSECAMESDTLSDSPTMLQNRLPSAIGWMTIAMYGGSLEAPQTQCFIFCSTFPSF